MLTASASSSYKVMWMLAYAHEGDIYVLKADGSAPVRLTTDPAEDFDPSWSPDGTQDRLSIAPGWQREVYVMNADGSHQTNLTHHPGSDYSPAWSPDGKRIAFASNRDGDPNEIYLMDADGSNPVRVTDNPGIDEYPTWSPDGSQLAFSCTMGRVLPEGVGDFEICLINADGTGLVQLTDSPGESKLPTWSPDGTLIAFQSNRDGWPTLPEYTPLGYDANRYGDFDIYTMRVDGSQPTNLTQNPREDDTFPAWSSNGLIVFSRYGCLMYLYGDRSTIEQLSADGCTGLDSGEFPDWFQPNPLEGSGTE